MVYTDLLVLTDFLMNYIILIATSLILNRIIKLKKVFLASVIGTIPLILLFLNTNNLTDFIVTISFSLIMAIISFNYKDILYTLKNILYMYLISIFVAGSIYLINTYFLFNINNYILKPIILLLLSPIITYSYIKCLKKLKFNNSNYYKIDIYLKDRPKITLTGYLDTGNKLIDPYNHKPIILITKKILKYIPSKYILVPYNTIDNEGLLKCFPPKKIYIEKIGYTHKVLIGVIDNLNIEGAECLLNQKLFERVKLWLKKYFLKF